MQVNNLVPKGGFFADYYRYAEKLTDAPEIYHIGSALAAMSAIVGGRAEGYFNVDINGENFVSKFPTHIWTLIIGPSGDRKSTAMNYAVQCIQEIVGAIDSISGSPEATVDLLANNPEAFFFHSEGSTLFSQLRADYWTQGQGILIDLYDGLDISRNLTGKRDKTSSQPTKIHKVKVRNPRATMLIGIAPDMLDSGRKSDWTGGLIGRMLLLYGERTRYNEVPALTDAVGSDTLIRQLYDIRNALNASKPLRIGVKQEAFNLYLEWARRLDGETKHRPPKIQALFRRLPLHILRVAILYAISQYHSMVNLDSMRAALAIGDYSRGSIERVGDLLADDPVMRNAIRIRDMLRYADGRSLNVGQISEALRISWGVLEPAIRTLLATGKIDLAIDPENSNSKILTLL